MEKNLLGVLKIKTTFFCVVIIGAAKAKSEISTNNVLPKAGPTE